MTNNKTTAWRVRQLEKRIDKKADDDDVSEIKKDVKRIMTNHLPHINTSIISMKTRINVLTAVNIGAIISGLIVSKLL